MKKTIIYLLIVWVFYSCQEKKSPDPVYKTPVEIIDLGNLVTEDLTERIASN